MAADWAVDEEMVELLLTDESACVKTRLQAVVVLQHCGLRGMSLLEFFQSHALDGLRIVPICDVDRTSEAHMKGYGVIFQFGDWQEDASKPIEWRLKRLRQHIAEVRLGGDMQLLKSLLNHERQLVKQCERMPTLGLVADDPVGSSRGALVKSPSQILCGDGAVPRLPDFESDVERNSSALPADDPLAAEAAEIAAVLENPKSVVAIPEPQRVNAKGQPLVSEATLKKIYSVAKSLGFANDIAAQEALCAKQGLSSIGDLIETAAVEIVTKMEKRLAAV